MLTLPFSRAEAAGEWNGYTFPVWNKLDGLKGEKVMQAIETKIITNTEECFAEPDGRSIIDGVHPFTGRGIYSGETLEQIQKRYPLAVRMLADDFCRAKAVRQDSPVQWDEISEEQYDEWLNCLPPAKMEGGAFLVGEPSDHHAVSGQPRYQACRYLEGKCFASSRPITVKEFKAI